MLNKTNTKKGESMKLNEKKDERKEDVSSSRKARQDDSKGKRFVDSPFKAEAEKEELAV